MPTISRAEILRRLRTRVAEGFSILGAGASIGLAARSEESGGADLIIIYNSGRYRRAGFSSLAGLFAYGDANAIVLDLASEILPVVKNTPVLAGVNASDPFRNMAAFLQQLRQMGFSGVMNFPTAGLFDGIMRAAMEETGLGYDREIELIATAHEMELFTSPYVFTPEEASAMAEAGADCIVPHVGLTVVGGVGANIALTLDDAIDKVMSMAEAAQCVRRDVLVLCHGGPFDEPETVGAALARMPGVVGLFAASHVERLPAERGIQAKVEAYRALQLS